MHEEEKEEWVRSQCKKTAKADLEAEEKAKELPLRKKIVEEVKKAQERIAGKLKVTRLMESDWLENLEAEVGRGN